MSRKSLWLALSVVSCIFLAASAGERDSSGVARMVCVGRVEAIGGEVEVSAQMAGTIKSVSVKEGDWVTSGTVLVELDAPREKAALDQAVANLAKVKAGNGKEEIAAAEANEAAVEAELAYADAQYKRALQLHGKTIITEDELEQRRQSAETLSKQLIRAKKVAAAMIRGPLPEDLALAEAEVATAQAVYDLHFIRAYADGTILELQRHVGDYVSLSYPAPILRMANTRALRVRLEISEQDVFRVKPGLAGEFVIYGSNKKSGQLVVTTVLPAFTARRLFEPDSTARMDTRTLNVLGDFQGPVPDIYPGQRIIATFPLPEK